MGGCERPESPDSPEPAGPGHSGGTVPDSHRVPPLPLAGHSFSPPPATSTRPRSRRAVGAAGGHPQPLYLGRQLAPDGGDEPVRVAAPHHPHRRGLPGDGVTQGWAVRSPLMAPGVNRPRALVAQLRAEPGSLAPLATRPDLARG
ncbi:hypothetical protein L083_5174 [Actinoplanes sp. N902-109]|nr:hypothetical protein L083_5174 [Actinoplanes sp. N902-109]